MSDLYPASFISAKIPGVPFTTTQTPEDLTDVNGVLYFAANDSLHGQELWVFRSRRHA